MSIQKRPDGKWRARYRDAAGKEHARHFDRQSDARHWLETVKSDQLRGTYVDPKAGRITLAEFYAVWSQHQVWATGTRVAMDLAMRGCTFADIPLQSLRHSHVQAWVKTMSTTLEPGTVRTRFNNVRSVVKGAVRDKRLHENPLDDVTLPRQRRKEHAMSIPSPEQVGEVLRAAPQWFVPFVALCAFGGLRLGEAAAVQVSDVDFLRRSLHVRRQVQRAAGGKVEITPPKYGSERVVFLPDELVEILSAHVRDVGVSGREQWLFGAGQPPHQNTVGHWWRKTIAAAGVPAMRLHDLRHFYASGLIAAGCDVVTVQRALGHSSATTTLRTYSHLWPDAEDRTRAAASELLRTSLAVPADSVRTGVVRKARTSH